MRSGTTAVSFVLLALLSVAVRAPAQAASYSIQGSGCSSGRLVPALGPVPLVVRGLPRLGSTFSIETEPTAGYPNGVRRATVLLTGTSNTASNGIRLPFDLARLSTTRIRFCGSLGCSAEVVLPVPPARDPLSRVQVPLQVPADPAFLGLRFYQQVVSVERSTFGPPFLGVAVSALGTGTVGR